jgi:hypothetical protein
MIERLHRRRSAQSTEGGEAPFPHVLDAGPESTVSVPPPQEMPAESEPMLLGFPAEIEPDDSTDDVPYGGPQQTGATVVPERALRMSVRRRADLIAGGALALAGVAANVSLWLPWVTGEDQTGLVLIDRAVRAARAGLGELLRDGLWQPVTIVLCGGVLAVLGLLVILPAHTHRCVGVLALLAALAAAAAGMSLLSGAGWDFAGFGPGLWAGVAVAGFGLLGAFKAMLTLPVLTVEAERGPAR